MSYAKHPTESEAGKRIAVVGRLDHPGGVQSVILSLIRGLNRAGITPDLVWDEHNPALLREKGVKARFQPVRFHISSAALDRASISARYILRILNFFTDRNITQSYDFYYIFQNSFVVTNGAPHVRYLSGPPLLPQLDKVSPGLRGLPYRSFRVLYRWFFRRWFPIYEYHRGSQYVINSEFTAALFEQAHGVRLPVIHPPIDLSGRGFIPGDFSRRDTVTYFSRFASYKRPDLVLELARRHPELPFTLMGGLQTSQEQYYHMLLERVKERCLENVTFVMNPGDEQVREVLARSKFYIFTARNEHFGMTTAESIASGAIPFVHDSGGQREIVPDARLRFTDENFLERFDTLLRLSLSELMEIQTRAAAHVKEFSEEAFIQKMLSFIE